MHLREIKEAFKALHDLYFAKVVDLLLRHLGGERLWAEDTGHADKAFFLALAKSQVGLRSHHRLLVSSPCQSETEAGDRLGISVDRKPSGAITPVLSGFVINHHSHHQAKHCGLVLPRILIGVDRQTSSLQASIFNDKQVSQ
eukprot:scaffold647953_cov44-Prasinocladus_malaysianus.AAC.1